MHLVVIWRSPALAILAASTLGAMAVAVVFLFVPALADLPGAVALFPLGLFIFGGDVMVRRRRGLHLFDLSASTLFVVFPTWTLGAAVLALATGLVLLGSSSF